MSINRNAPELKVTPERIEEIMKAAHLERSQAVRQLFGFGFTVVKDAVRSGFGYRAPAGRTPATDGASCG